MIRGGAGKGRFVLCPPESRRSVNDPVADVPVPWHILRMSGPQNQVLKWEPLPDLPQLPLSFVGGSFDGDRLKVEATFAYGAERTSVLIEFGAVEAHEVCEEFSDWLLTIDSPLPRLVNPKLPTYTWPFLEVRNSSWVAEKIARNGTIDEHDWKHLVVLTLDRTLHVMIAGEVESAAIENDKD